MTDCLVVGRKPSPIEMSVRPVRKRTIELLPLCDLPKSQNSGGGARRMSASLARAKAASAERGGSAAVLGSSAIVTSRVREAVQPDARDSQGRSPDLCSFFVPDRGDSSSA